MPDKRGGAAASTLHNNASSTCSQKVRLVLAEKRIAVATPAVRHPSFDRAYVRRPAKMTAEEFACQVDARPIRKRVIGKTGRQGCGTKESQAALEGALRRGHWLVGGDGPSIAARCIAPLLDRMGDLDRAYLRGDAPAVGARLARFRRRPSRKATFHAAARMSDMFDHLDRTRRTLPNLPAC